MYIVKLDLIIPTSLVTVDDYGSMDSKDTYLSSQTNGKKHKVMLSIICSKIFNWCYNSSCLLSHTLTLSHKCRPNPLPD